MNGIFHGPHSYISPRYYKSEFNVPTWNYAAVSLTGTIQLVEDRQAALQVIQDLVGHFEGSEGWKFDTNDERYMNLLDAVVCFSIRIETVEAKFKLNQNKTEEDRRSVIGHLLGSPSPLDQVTGQFMQDLCGER